jgi:hypothetical protein
MPSPIFTRAALHPLIFSLAIFWYVLILPMYCMEHAQFMDWTLHVDHAQQTQVASVIASAKALSEAAGEHDQHTDHDHQGCSLPMQSCRAVDFLLRPDNFTCKIVSIFSDWTPPTLPVPITPR